MFPACWSSLTRSWASRTPLCSAPHATDATFGSIRPWRPNVEHQHGKAGTLGVMATKNSFFYMSKPWWNALKSKVAGKWAFIAPNMLPKLNDKLINLSKPIKTKHTSEWVSTIHPSVEMPGMRTNHQVIGIWETRIALDPKNNPEPSGCCQQRW